MYRNIIIECEFAFSFGQDLNNAVDDPSGRQREILSPQNALRNRRFDADPHKEQQHKLQSDSQNCVNVTQSQLVCQQNLPASPSLTRVSCNDYQVNHP